MEKNRLKALAGIREAEIMNTDDVHDQDIIDLDNLTARQKKIERLVRYALDKAEIPYDKHESNSVMYDERNEREVTVELSLSVPLDVLMRLKNTGLSNKYIISGSRDGVSVSFSVSPDLDHVVEEVPRKPRRW